MRKQLDYQKALLNAHLEAGNSKFVENFLLEKLDKQFSHSLLVYLEELQLSDYYPLILLLEKKLENESEKGLLHQALAHLLFKEDKVGAAIQHLQESVKTVPNIKDFSLLAELLQKEDRDSEANEYYRLGLFETPE
jgi:HemY protein